MTRGETFQGKSCRKCGGTERYVRGKTCTVCQRAREDRRRAYKADNTRKWREANPDHMSTWREENKEHVSAYNQQWVAANPGYKRPYEIADPNRGHRRHILKHYGLTAGEYDSMSAAQGGKCAICHETPKQRLHVDHNHTTGLVRALLCGNCNRSIGMMKEQPDRLRNAAAYLEKYASRTSGDTPASLREFPILCRERAPHPHEERRDSASETEASSAHAERGNRKAA